MNDESADEAPTSLLASIERDEEMLPFDEFNQNSRKGFLRLSLKGTDFGHKEYPTAYTKRVLVALNPPATEPPTDYTDQLPKEPYTPEIEELSLNYVSAEKIRTQKLSTDEYDDRG